MSLSWTTATAGRLPLNERTPSHADMVQPSRRFLGVDAKVCIKATDTPTGVTTQPWSIDYADDTTARPIDEWWDGEFSVSLYPADRPLDVGQCVRGWIMFRPLKGRPVRVAYTPGGISLAWRIPATKS